MTLFTFLTWQIIMQTNSFSINRLLLLLKYDLFGVGKRFWLIFGALILMLGLSINTVNSNLKYASRDDWTSIAVKPYLYFDAVFMMFPISHLVVGMLFTSIMFFQFSNKEEKQIYLSLPATVFEKWLSKWVITALFFPIVFLFVFLIGIEGIMMYNEVSLFSVRDSGMLIGNHIFQAVKWYWILHAMFFLGGLSFNKWAGVKTFFVIMFALLVLTFTARTSFFLFFGDWLPFSDFSNLLIASNFSRIVIGDLNLEKLNSIIYIISILAAVVFLITSYFKLKEKEVA